MSKKGGNEATFFMPREKTTKVQKKRLRGQPKTMETTAPTHFLPSFAVRRPIIKTEETEEFLKQAREILPRNVSVSITGMTIVEQRKMVQQFREVEATPDPDRVEEIAHSVSRILQDTIKSTPRRLDVPMGRVFRFGSHNTKLGVVPEGWRGYSAHYARRGSNGERLPQRMFVRETIASLGGLAAAFSEETGTEREMKIADLGSETPHLTFACRPSAGFSQAEERALAGQLEEILPECISLFDPVIYLKLAQNQEQPILIHPRSPGDYRSNGLVDL